jgi:tripartite-type tricarboxylate transporter receptor subunit TctC
MQLPRFVIWLILAGMIALGADTVFGQNYPNKTIRIITTGTGGGSDFAARLIAQGLSGSLGQQAIVENRSAGILPAEIVSKATPDGYTLVLYASSLWIVPLLQKVSFDPVKDFAPITWALATPNVVVVNSTLPVKSIRELIALAKTKPGQLNYGSSGTGSANHLAGELFKAMAGIDIVRINYKNVTEAVHDLVAGQVHLMFINAPTVMPHVSSGRLRALAVASMQPSALVPDLPTVSASGLPGYESVSTFCVLAPAKTPEAIIHRLNREIVQYINREDVKARLFKAGVEVVGSSPAQLAALIKSDMTKLGKVIKDAGIRAE